MPIILDHQLREQIPHNAIEFPITYFHDELITLPNLAGPLHWHPDFEIATAECGVLDYQVGEQHIILEAGDSIFVNGNTLHGIKQLSGDVPDPMPNIVFSGTLIAPETSSIYQQYILPIALGILIAVILYAAGSGLIEVLVSPIVEACPFDNKDGMMSLLHSFYCWGQWVLF